MIGVAGAAAAHLLHQMSARSAHKTVGEGAGGYAGLIVEGRKIPRMDRLLEDVHDLGESLQPLVHLLFVGGHAADFERLDQRVELLVRGMAVLALLDRAQLEDVRHRRHRVFERADEALGVAEHGLDLRLVEGAEGARQLRRLGLYLADLLGAIALRLKARFAVGALGPLARAALQNVHRAMTEPARQSRVDHRPLRRLDVAKLLFKVARGLLGFFDFLLLPGPIGERLPPSGGRSPLAEILCRPFELFDFAGDAAQRRCRLIDQPQDHFDGHRAAHRPSPRP